MGSARAPLICTIFSSSLLHGDVASGLPSPRTKFSMVYASTCTYLGRRPPGLLPFPVSLLLLPSSPRFLCPFSPSRQSLACWVTPLAPIPIQRHHSARARADSERDSAAPRTFA